MIENKLLYMKDDVLHIMANEYNQQLPKRQFTIRYQEEEDGGYSGQCLEIPGAISQGDTLEEFKENMKDAISLILESIKEEANIQKKKSLIIEI
jgi:predicted RNase H-like HicB family nuclease